MLRSLCARVTSCRWRVRVCARVCAAVPDDPSATRHKHDDGLQPSPLGRLPSCQPAAVTGNQTSPHKTNKQAGRQAGVYRLHRRLAQRLVDVQHATPVRSIPKHHSMARCALACSHAGGCAYVSIQTSSARVRACVRARATASALPYAARDRRTEEPVPSDPYERTRSAARTPIR